VTHDSRAVVPGGLFVAILGDHVDGHAFVPAAVAGGAAALIVEHPIEGVAVPQLIVHRSPPSLAAAAAWWFGDPSHQLGVVGITGTDGKTTTAFLAVAGLTAAGLRVGSIGTIATRIGGLQSANQAHATTPDAPRLQAMLRAMAAAGDQVAVVETTSHGLALDRVAEVAYDAAILTNVTHEHLELHGTWEAYRDAKLSLFERLRAGSASPAKTVDGVAWPKVAVVNLDDPSAGRFVGAARDARADVVTYGTDPGADLRATRVEEGPAGLRFRYDGPGGGGEVRLQLGGRFNVHNGLAVLGLAWALGLDRAAVATGMGELGGVPGRMERIDAGQAFEVVIDYAHSPAALEKVLDLLAPAAAARGGGLIAVFGSAGERDTAKRPLMGRIAGGRCRLVILTDEDPRGEDRMAILDEIAVGAEAVGKRRDHDLLLIPDRGAAIAAAFERARSGDLVLLAGKGHERSIIGPTGEVPWDERTVAVETIRAFGLA
jgi:UDP-N-acetylmuramoyl-L-alanyl-D-glutamate--2,6-diaminopimelate ligase